MITRKNRETVRLKYLQVGDYFIFQGREQMYVVVYVDYDLIRYQSTYSGRIYSKPLWKANSVVEIYSYGN